MEVLLLKKNKRTKIAPKPCDLQVDQAVKVTLELFSTAHRLHGRKWLYYIIIVSHFHYYNYSVDPSTE